MAGSVPFFYKLEEEICLLTDDIFALLVCAPASMILGFEKNSA